VHGGVVHKLAAVGAACAHIVGGDVSVNAGNVDSGDDVSVIHGEARYFFDSVAHIFQFLIICVILLLYG
jgi:hypothetical protein